MPACARSEKGTLQLSIDCDALKRALLDVPKVRGLRRRAAGKSTDWGWCFVWVKFRDIGCHVTPLGFWQQRRDCLQYYWPAVLRPGHPDFLLVHCLL